MKAFSIIFLIFANTFVYGIDYEERQMNKCEVHFNRLEAKYDLPINTLKAISIKESGRRHSKNSFVKPWPWAVNHKGKGYFFKTKAEATRFVKKKLKSGDANIDVGCAQINLKYHPLAFNSVEQAFDPKSNIEYAGFFLKSNYEKYKNWYKAISSYHSKTDSLGKKYADHVLTILINIQNTK